MTLIEDFTISSAYERLITHLQNEEEINGTKELTNCCLIVKNPTLDNISFPRRQISENYANAEMKWYWSADNSCKSIGQHAKMWLNISDDGETSNSAYGYIIHRKYDYDQLQEIIEVLRRDKYSRRAVLNISDPYINRLNTKDMQCTIALQFLIRNGNLEETVYMRSNDVYFGLPYDYIYFVSIGQYVAEQLGIKLTLYTHHATSMHMYKRNFDRFCEKFENQSLTIDWKTIVKNNYKVRKDNDT